MPEQQAPTAFERQESLYAFPYHYIPHFLPGGGVSRQRFLGWGFEYLCYMMHVVSIVDHLKPDSLLDVGCGDGRLFSLLSWSPGRQVGADLSRRAIRHAQAFNPSVDFQVQAIADVEGKFDVVTAVEVLEHVAEEDLGEFIEGVEERLKPGGHFVLSVPSTVRPVQRKHHRHYDLSELRQQIDLSDRLEIIRSEYIYRDSWLLRIWRLLSRNPVWTVELHGLNKIIWSWIWNRLRFASADDGCHIVAVCRKV